MLKKGYVGCEHQKHDDQGNSTSLRVDQFKEAGVEQS